MWVRAQVDYLQRLPNDLEKRRALAKLPPDLPRTYIRIFETISSNYPPQTIQYIQRLLRWLVFLPRGEFVFTPYNSTRTYKEGVLLEMLCRAICIENESDWPTIDIMPSAEQILRWLGCLARFDELKKTIQLSHFTVEEFLSLHPQTVSSPIARQFLVDLEDEEYIVNVSLTYLLHNHFERTKCTTGNDVEAFLSEDQFYEYTMYSVSSHLSSYTRWNGKNERLIKKFLSMPPSSAFRLWETCRWWKDSNMVGPLFGKFSRQSSRLPSPLHLAAALGLENCLEEILYEGVDPDTIETLEGSCITPLHLAICADSAQFPKINPSTLELRVERLKEILLDGHFDKRQVCFSSVTDMLVKYGADVDRQLHLSLDKEDGKAEQSVTATPLVLALICGNWRLASQLLNAGAAWNTTAHVELEGATDACSVERLLDKHPELGDILQQAVNLSGHSGLAETLKDWRLLQDEGDSHIPSKSRSAERSIDLQDAFIAAFSNADWQDVRELLSRNSGLDVDCVNETRWSAIHYASMCKGDALRFLLEYGGSPNLVSPGQNSALCIASESGYVENAQLLLEFGADLENPGYRVLTPLLSSVRGRQRDVLRYLIDAGADINATADDGVGALHIAIQQQDEPILEILSASVIDKFRPDNYGTTPLHLACNAGLEDQVEQLLASMATPAETLNGDSLIYGTPLYRAAYSGSASIIKSLLDHGAKVDQISSGNLLGSALMGACASGQCAAVETLLSRGAALEVEGSRFKSAEGTARAFRNEKVLELLKKHR